MIKIVFDTVIVCTPATECSSVFVCVQIPCKIVYFGWCFELNNETIKKKYQIRRTSNFQIISMTWRNPIYLLEFKYTNQHTQKRRTPVYSTNICINSLCNMVLRKHWVQKEPNYLCFSTEHISPKWIT